MRGGLFIRSEHELRLHRCCFTGHRPEKIKVDPSTIRSWLNDAIDRAIRDGYRTFITGMARGVDIWAAELVLKKRVEQQGIHLICALPHPNFEVYWQQEWREKYHDIINQADLVKTISTHYWNCCYQVRNEWMVDHAARIICVYNGQPSGTRNTIMYAQRRGIEIDCLDLARPAISNATKY